MKKHIALFLVVAMLLALCACTSQPAKDTTSEQTTADASSNSDAAANTDDSTETAASSGETVTIRVSGLNQQLSLPLWYIHEQGWDVENGFNLELTVFAQGSGINEALGSGLVDVLPIGAARISSCSSTTRSTSIPMRTPAPARTLSSAPTATSRRSRASSPTIPKCTAAPTP